MCAVSGKRPPLMVVHVTHFSNESVGQMRHRHVQPLLRASAMPWKGRNVEPALARVPGAKPLGARQILQGPKRGRSEVLINKHDVDIEMQIRPSKGPNIRCVLSDLCWCCLICVHCWCSSLDGVRTPSGDVTLQREDYVKLRSGRMGRVACLSWSKELYFQELIDIRGLNVLLNTS